MGKAKFRPPSKVDSLSFPVFGLTWHGSPATPKHDGVSFTAHCGGGGSAKTGVGNKIIGSLVAQYPDDNDTNKNGGYVSTRTIEISTGEALCFGIHAFRPHDDRMDMVRLIACVGDEILLYGIPIHVNDDDNNSNNGGAILLASASVGKGYGANVAVYTAVFNSQLNQLQHMIGVGCENGHLVIFQITDTAADIASLSNNNNTAQQQPHQQLSKVIECHGHTKAVCAIQFHPRGHQILSSAKDGTARIFSTSTGTQLGQMTCEVHDPNGPPPPVIDPSKSKVTTKDPRMMKRAPQILVRGCAYGDLEGKVIYTVASGKRGAAYLTKWHTKSPQQSQPPQQQQLQIQQEYRVQCSPVPISATSLSSDCTLFSMGSVEGSILLYNLETKSIIKQFNEVHDLPVTCLTSRPIPSALMLPGELEGGVNFDVVSASADNRMGRWTLQKKSRIKADTTSAKLTKRRRKKGPVEQFVWDLVRIPFLLVVVLILVAVRDVSVVCRDEFGMPAVLLDVGAAGHCLYREVLWAEESRPGVKFVPV